MTSSLLEESDEHLAAWYSQDAKVVPRDVDQDWIVSRYVTRKGLIMRDLEMGRKGRDTERLWLVPPSLGYFGLPLRRFPQSVSVSKLSRTRLLPMFEVRGGSAFGYVCSDR